MTIPASVRVNAQFPFPSLVMGSGPIAITKSNGIWTVSFNPSAIAQVTTVPNPTTTYAMVYDATTGLFFLLQASAVSSAKSVKTLQSAASPYAALPADDVLLINGVPFTVNVDWSQRTKPLRIVDITGNASVGSPITITPANGQTQLAQLNYSYTIDGAGGSITLTPLPNNTGAY